MALLVWFYNTSIPKSIPVCHEFGTQSALDVLRAIRLENAMAHHAPEKRDAAALGLRNAFYLHNSCPWKEAVVRDGCDAFQQAMQYLGDVKSCSSVFPLPFHRERA